MKFSKRYLLCFYIVSPSFYFSNVTIWNVVIKLKHWYKSKNDFNSLRVNDQKNSMWRQIYWIFMSFYQEEGRVVCGAKSQKEREDYLIPLLDTVGTSMLFRPLWNIFIQSFERKTRKYCKVFWRYQTRGKPFSIKKCQQWHKSQTRQVMLNFTIIFLMLLSLFLTLG